MSDDNIIPKVGPDVIIRQGWEEIAKGSCQSVPMNNNTFATMGNLPEHIGLELDAVEKEMRESNFAGLEKYNETLVGHIQKEFIVPEDKVPLQLKLFLTWMAGITLEKDPFYSKMFHKKNDTTLLIHVDKLWVNYQSKYEFNPPHSHAGILSYVIWNKIPFDIKEEMKVFPNVGGGDSDANLTSSFNFHFPSSYGAASYPILVDKKMQNYICMFPATLSHSVNPFYTSDDYRVSFAGNLFLTDSHNKNLDKE
jgi:hypothetical protein